MRVAVVSDIHSNLHALEAVLEAIDREAPDELWCRGELAGGVAPDGKELELDGVRALLNPGSVGQPRDGDPRAAYLLLDLAAQRATFHRVEYDVETTQREMRDAGLPEMLAARLQLGL